MIILRQNENLIKAVRRHWIFVAPSLIGWPLLAVALTVLKYYFVFDFWGYWIWAMLAISAIVLFIILRRYYLWATNVLVVTDQRVVENEQRGFFSKTVTELLFKDILEISYNKEGLNASLYNFGDIKIRTASENDIIISQIPAPESVVETINRTRQKLSDAQ